MTDAELIAAIQNCDRRPLSQGFCHELVRRGFAMKDGDGWLWDVEALKRLDRAALERLHNALTTKV